MFSEVYGDFSLRKGVDEHLQRVQPRIVRQFTGMTYHGRELLIVSHHGCHHAQIDCKDVPQTPHHIQGLDLLYDYYMHAYKT